MDTSEIQDVAILRYLIVSGATVFIYEIALTFSKELDFIWNVLWQPQKPSSVRLCFILGRYLEAAALVLFVYNGTTLLRNHELSDTWYVKASLNTMTSLSLISIVISPPCRCRGASMAIGVMIIISDMIWHCLTLLRVFILWDRDKWVLRAIIFGIAFSYAVCMSFVILTLRAEKRTTVYNTVLNVCANGPTRLLEGVWWSEAVLDIYVILLVICNAIAKPRTEQQRLVETLQHDGLFLLLMTTGLRILNAIFCLTKNLVLAVAGLAFIEPLIATINSRLFFRLNKELSTSLNPSDRDSLAWSPDSPHKRDDRSRRLKADRTSGRSESHSITMSSSGDDLQDVYELSTKISSRPGRIIR